MSSRADKLEQLHKSLKKHFKYVEDTTERNVLECLLYACCLEDSKAELADEAFAKLQQSYFDWNEVRVTTVIELSEVLNKLPTAAAAGSRIKRSLQSLYESRYQYDIDDLKKANLSKATEDLQSWQGITHFVLNYISQHALGGHAIPVDTNALNALVAIEILTGAEAEKKTVPGAERAIPKNKGLEFSSLLHQFAHEFANSPKSASVAAVFKDLGVTLKAPPPPAAPPKKKSPPAPAAEPVAEPDAKLAKEESATPSKGAAKASAATKPAAAPKSGKAEPKTTTKEAAAKKETKSEATPAAAAKPKESKTKAEPAKPATKSASSKSVDKAAAAGKPAKGDETSKSPAKASSKAKAVALKAKASTEKVEKSDTKKPAAAPKKPAKMANNVKMTKKKPK